MNQLTEGYFEKYVACNQFTEGLRKDCTGQKADGTVLGQSSK